MASLSEDENITAAEETGKRRTRSGRKTNAPIPPPTPTRTTRRSTRKKSELEEIHTADEDIENKPEVIEEVCEEQINQLEQFTTMETSNTDQQIIQNDNSTSFPFGNNIQSGDMAALYDQSSIGTAPSNNEEPQQSMITNTTDSIDNLLANLAEDNANSLPSGDDESRFAAIIGNNQHAADIINLNNITEECSDQLDGNIDDKNKTLNLIDQQMEINEVINELIEQPPVVVTENDEKPHESEAIMTTATPTTTSATEVAEATTNIVSDNTAVADTEMEIESSSANTSTESQVAIAEDLPNGDNSQSTKVDVDAEMVSEDELPAPSQEKVDDAEEVSDEELPGPKLADLPEDTEVVSEDELPTTNKTKRKVDEGYDPGSPTESSEIPEKKLKEGNDDVQDNTSTIIDEKEKKKEKDKKEDKEKKTLPDLDKYWKAVKDDPADFTGWTYLLQYVDQENDIEAARAAYDAFLSHYPYCYGYWRKYADCEKRKGNKKKCEEVFERGLKAIPLSVDLWIHFLTHVKQNNPEDDKTIRFQFERALENCGLEFRSDKLWEAYIKWESEAKRIQNVVAIYDRLLATPTQGYNGHFDSFQEIVNNNSVNSLIPIEEFKRIRTEIREQDQKDTNSTVGVSSVTTSNTAAAAAAVDTVTDKDVDAAEATTTTTTTTTTTPSSTSLISETVTAEIEDASIVPGEEEPDDHVRNEDEATAIKDKILSIRRKIHKATVSAVTARWTFEEGIKRPYFHVKPLERCQLKNWKEYLDFEIEQGDRKRVLVLFERCLIACALYDDFWLKLIRYLESQNDVELISKTRDAYERACSVHHPDKPSLHMMWASFEECNDNASKSSEILANLEINSPNLLQIAYRRINLERRRGDLNRCDQLYKEYIESAKSKTTAGSLSIKYARFCHKIKNNLDEALEILKTALEKDPGNTRVVLQMIDLALQRPQVNESEVLEIIDSYMARDNMDLDQKVLFAQRKVEFLEDFGSTAKILQDAQRELQSILSKANEAKKKSELSPTKKTVKEAAPSQSTSSSSNYYNSYGGSGSNNSSSYYNTSSQYGSQSYNDGYGYNQQWQQYGSNFGGYGQWSGYGSSGYY